MTWKKLQRLLACLLVVLLLSQVGAFLPAARAAGGYTLQNGSAIIKPGMSDAEVNRALTRALVVGFDQKRTRFSTAFSGSISARARARFSASLPRIPTGAPLMGLQA